MRSRVTLDNPFSKMPRVENTTRKKLAMALNTGRGHAQGMSTRQTKRYSLRSNDSSSDNIVIKVEPEYQPQPQVQATVELDASVDQGTPRAGDAARERSESSSSSPSSSPSSASCGGCCKLTKRLEGAIEKTLEAVKENCIRENARLVYRLTTGRCLPIFAGDPLEWFNFKECYELSTRLGGFDERENRLRLFEALRGTARDLVRMLLATNCKASLIMESLEQIYENHYEVARTVYYELLELQPKNYLELSIKVKSAIEAFKKLNCWAYLHSPDIINSVLGKIPWIWVRAYRHHVINSPNKESELEMLSEIISDFSRTDDYF